MLDFLSGRFNLWCSNFTALLVIRSGTSSYARCWRDPGLNVIWASCTRFFPYLDLIWARSTTALLWSTQVTAQVLSSTITYGVQMIKSPIFIPRSVVHAEVEEVGFTIAADMSWSFWPSPNFPVQTQQKIWLDLHFFNLHYSVYLKQCWMWCCNFLILPQVCSISRMWCWWGHYRIAMFPITLLELRCAKLH